MMKKSDVLARVYGSLILAVVCLLSCTTMDPFDPAQEDLTQYRSAVTGLTARYESSQDKIILRWNALPGVDGYHIYKTSGIDSSGFPDTVTLSRSVLIPPNSDSFPDVPMLGNGVYYYTIRAVRYFGEDTVEGQFSPQWPGFVPCTVGVNVRFTIQRGDLFVAARECSLFVDDPDRALAKVQFAQLGVNEYLDSTSGVWTVVVDTSRPDSLDTYGQLALIKKSKFVPLATNSGLYTSTHRTTPSFSTDDTMLYYYLPPDTAKHIIPREYNLTDSSGGTYGFRWRLSPKTGIKTVYAILTYRDGSITPDTVMDFITPTPHRVELIIRNSQLVSADDTVNGPDAPVKDTSVFVGIDTTRRFPIHLFYFPTLKFSVRNFSDAVIDTSFDVWMAIDSFSDNIGNASFSAAGKTNWYLTRPQHLSLTGSGELHSSEYRYEYCIDPTRAKGLANLETVTKGKQVKISKVIDTTPTVAFNFLKALDYNKLLMNDNLDVTGRKQFLVMARFHDNAFDDDFLYVFGYSDTSMNERTFFGFYPPATRFQTSNKNPYFMDSNTVITAPFSFALKGDTGTTCIKSGAYAKMTQLALVIARKPAYVNWSDAAYRSRFTVDSMLAMPNDVFPIPLAKPDYIIPPPIRWSNIDPTYWPSGSYIMGVVAVDEFNRRWFVSAYYGATATTMNPWMVQVRTGN